MEIGRQKLQPRRRRRGDGCGGSEISVQELHLLILNGGCQRKRQTLQRIKGTNDCKHENSKSRIIKREPSFQRKKRKMQARKRNFKLAVAARMQCRTSQTHHQRKRLKSVNRRMKRLRLEMKEISEEKKEIKVGQKMVREKFEAIELECEELRKETILITQQTANTQIRLALMFQILKARQNQELDKATILTHALRDLIERGNQQRKL